MCATLHSDNDNREWLSEVPIRLKLILALSWSDGNLRLTENKLTQKWTSYFG